MLLVRRFSTMAQKILYKEHLQLEDLVEGLNDGRLFRGILRILQKKHELAFVENPASGEKDVLVEGTDQNRALHGDLVAVELHPKDRWKLLKGDLIRHLTLNDSEGHPVEAVSGENSVTYKGETYDMSNVDDKFFQKTGMVVGVMEQKHSRKAMGYAKAYNKNFGLFSPIDTRVPRMLIPLKQLPNGFEHRPKDFHQSLMIASVERWEVTGKFAIGRLVESIGGDNDDLVHAATRGILCEFDLDDLPFPDDINEEIPDFEITSFDVAERAAFDFRNKCVFTIDPATARDLDDACSVEDLGGGVYEVGVHIADVSHFVKPGTEVDNIARNRTTSVYLVQRVIPMLPRKLCEDYCSLNPGIDRLSFSVVWKMNREGEILERRFGKSLIRSCCKLHYEHAQDMIEEPDREFESGYLPEIHNGFTVTDLSRRIGILHGIAQKLRQKRKECGSLSIQQCKLAFSLNQHNSMPSAIGSYKSKESNKLIEEFMLKANESVAEKLLEHYPENAIIRRHIGPKEEVLRDTGKLFEKLGIEIDISSSKAMQKALNTLNVSPNLPSPLGLVVASLLAKSMSLATYHSTGEFDSEEEYMHYGLSMPLYTHFTSPIRRYPDLIAHRQLQAILEGMPPEEPMSFEDVSELALLSTEKKYTAKLASEKSSLLFLWLFLRDNNGMLEPAVITEIGTEAISVLVLRYGLTIRLWKRYMEKGVEFQSKEGEWATIRWPKTDSYPAVDVSYRMLDEVVVRMKAGDQLFAISGGISRPGSYDEKQVPRVNGVASEDV